MLQEGSGNLLRSFDSSCRGSCQRRVSGQDISASSMITNLKTSLNDELKVPSRWPKHKALEGHKDYQKCFNAASHVILLKRNSLVNGSANEATGGRNSGNICNSVNNELHFQDGKEHRQRWSDKYVNNLAYSNVEQVSWSPSFMKWRLSMPTMKRAFGAPFAEIPVWAIALWRRVASSFPWFPLPSPSLFHPVDWKVVRPFHVNKGRTRD